MKTPFATSLRPVNKGILILDYGSQYTLLIARRLREIGVYTEVVAATATCEPEGFCIAGVILSGGPDSVTENSGRQLPDWVLNIDVPVLGICYGMQLLVHHFGGRVRAATKREYGRSHIVVERGLSSLANRLMSPFTNNGQVWMSHGDDIESVPSCLTIAARSNDGVVAAITHTRKSIFGIQFHPEVEHTVGGKNFLQGFAHEICKMNDNWQTQDMLASSISSIKSTVGSGHVLIACSGGVDSTVAAALMLKALGANNVTAIFCDTGLMRKGEVNWVAENLKTLGLKDIAILNSSAKFFAALEGITDPEQKRKIIGKLFIEEFEHYARMRKDHGVIFSHLGQGTLYPDVIESAGHGAGSQVIKSHHNVGGLPEKLSLPLVEPFRFLFKDEVRKLGELLGLPHNLVHRHPFPGPGLAVRILGEITEERAHILREADAVFIGSLREENLYDFVWQAFAVLLPVKTVGVMGDNRTYQYTIALRAVHSSDGMTAEVGRLPLDFLARVADRIVRNVPGVNRIVYDVTSKPPATIEWE